MSHLTRAHSTTSKPCSVVLPKFETSPPSSAGDGDGLLRTRRRSINRNLTAAAGGGGDRVPSPAAKQPEGSSESLHEGVDDKKQMSPTLARLKRAVSGKSLEETQKVLMRKHQDAKSRIDKISVGGGVSLWPDMDDMRLTACETMLLAVSSVLLCAVTIWVFFVVHGQLLSNLLDHNSRLLDFVHQHPLVTEIDNATFVKSVVAWHVDYRMAIQAVHDTFDVSLLETSASYKACIALYVCAVTTLLYYLADNVLTKSRLTPHRIKLWVSLLTVTATWTVLVLRLLIAAQNLEATSKANVHYLNEQLGDLVLLPIDLSMYRSVLLYWTSRCLLTASPQPLLSIMGLVAVGDVAYYLQYYSLPVLMAILVPVGRLLWSVANVYAAPRRASLPAAVLG